MSPINHHFKNESLTKTHNLHHCQCHWTHHCYPHRCQLEVLYLFEICMKHSIQLRVLVVLIFQYHPLLNAKK